MTEIIKLPYSYPVRRLRALQNKYSEKWKKNLLTLLFALVAEITISEHLNLIADSENIQPINQKIAIIHNKDECAHAAVCTQVAKLMYYSMNKKEKDFFIFSIPYALETYIGGDYATWDILLRALNFSHVDEIINDTKNILPNPRLIRNCSGIKRLLKELDLLEKIDFSFPFK